MSERHYKRRDERELGKYYTRHILAMIAEAFVADRFDIAAELAYRDKLIDELKDKLQGEK